MRILIVDDEVSLAEGVRRGLVAEGFAVDVAHDGIDGLWLARENTYDAIVLDLMMPGMSGWKVCAALRDEGDWTPILNADSTRRRPGSGRVIQGRRR